MGWLDIFEDGYQTAQTGKNIDKNFIKSLEEQTKKRKQVSVKKDVPLVVKSSTRVEPLQDNTKLNKQFKKVIQDKKNIQETKDFFKSYINSPKFKERALESGYGPESLAREEMYMDVNSPLYDPNYIPKIEEEKYSRLKSIDDVKIKMDYLGDQLDNLGEDNTTSSHYSPKHNIIKLRPNSDGLISKVNGTNTYKNDLRGTVAHELSHKIQEGSNKNYNGDYEHMFGLNKRENKMFLDRNLSLFKIKNRDEIINFKGNSEKAYNLLHDDRPSENKADIDAFRYELYKDGIYDTRTQNFKPEHLEKAKPSFIKERLQKHFTDDDIIELMNKIAQNKSKDSVIAKEGTIIKDDMGQWNHPGKITEINSNQITMRGVNYPVLGVSDVGDTKMMQPGEDYEFIGEKVTEYPMLKNGKKLINFTPSKTGWLSKYE